MSEWIEVLLRWLRAPSGGPDERLRAHIDKQFHTWARNLGTPSEALGGAQGRGAVEPLELRLTDLDGRVLLTEWGDPDYLSEQDIRAMAGYRELEQRARSLGLSVTLVREEDLAYLDEARYGYTVLVSMRD